MKPFIDIEEAHLKIVLAILQKHFSAHFTVWAFGSRVTRTAKKYSDLDLVIDAQSKPIPLSVMIDAANDFDESSLPYKVDLVDWNSIDEGFRNAIAHARVLLLVSE
jgi:predicted nucleotidyltransferase